MTNFTNPPIATSTDLGFVKPDGTTILVDGNGQATSGIPFTGQFAFSLSQTPPVGWIKANGALLNRTTYANLFAAIGTTFGVGDGSTTFAIPDMRAEFPRGWDDGRGVDTGRVFGSSQKGSIQTFDPTVANSAITGLRPSADEANAESNMGLDLFSGTYASVIVGVTSTDSASVALATSSGITRPRNVALLAVIKY